MMDTRINCLMNEIICDKPFGLPTRHISSLHDAAARKIIEAYTGANDVFDELMIHKEPERRAR